MNRIAQWFKDKWRRVVLTFLVPAAFASGGVGVADRIVDPYVETTTKYEYAIVQTIPDSGDAKVELSKDEPKVTLSKWGGEGQLVVKYPKVKKSGSRALLTDRVEWKEAKEEVHAYPIKPKEGMEEGGFEVEVVLKQKPDTNVFDFTIENAENLDFFYQPELTPEEIAEGSQRPENVVGSYAVYNKYRQGHATGKTNFATGKAYHIYRPKAIDANGVETWAELLYASSTLSVTVPQAFLDTAAYPVRVDPSFGFMAQGASGQDTTFNEIYATRFTSEAATTESISFWTSRVSPSNGQKGLLYSNDESATILQEVFSTVGTSTWTAPSGVTSAFVSCWGGGGGGDVISTSAGGGGGGGAFASSTLTVTPGNSYTVTIGAGGQGGTSPGTGGDSSFASSSNMLLAKGGSPANNTTGGAGGATSTSIGDVVFRGGNGGNGNSTGDAGGGGGGAGGPNGNGGNGASGSTSVGGGGGGGNGGDNATSTGGAAGGPGGGAGGLGDSNDATAPAGGNGVSASLGGGGGGGGDNGDPGGDGGTPGGGGAGGEVDETNGDGASGKCIVSFAGVGIPDALLDAGDAVSSGPTPPYTSANVSATIATGDYWLAMAGGVSGVTYNYDSNGTSSYNSGTNWFTTPPDLYPNTDDVFQNRTYSIYATYTPTTDDYPYFTGASSTAIEDADDTISHTTNASTSILAVCGGNHQGTIDGFTFNGDALTLGIQAASAFNETAAIWYLVNPDIGTYDLVMSGTGGTGHSMIAMNIANATTSWTPAVASSTGSDATAELTLTTNAAQSLVVDCAYAEDALTRNAPVDGVRIAVLQQDSFENAAAQYAEVPPSTARFFRWNIGSGQRWAHVAMGFEAGTDAAPPSTPAVRRRNPPPILNQ